MPSVPVIHYRPGAVVDVSCVLEVVGLKPHQWGPLERAYPVLRVVGPAAPFRRSGVVTIFPPHFVQNTRQLERLLSLYQTHGHSDGERLYRLRQNGQLASFAYYSTDGYPQLHIYYTTVPRRVGGRH